MDEHMHDQKRYLATTSTLHGRQKLGHTIWSTKPVGRCYVSKYQASMYPNYVQDTNEITSRRGSFQPIVG